MFRFSRRQLFKGLAPIFCILGISWLALDYFVPSPPSKITIATAFKGSTFDYFGRRYRERLARAGVKVEPRPTLHVAQRDTGHARTRAGAWKAALDALSVAPQPAPKTQRLFRG